MSEQLKNRTKKFALEVIKLVEQLSKGRTTDIIGKQLIRSGTSVGANYRAASRAKTPADSISKIGIVEVAGLSYGDLKTFLEEKGYEIIDRNIKNSFRYIFAQRYGL